MTRDEFIDFLTEEFTEDPDNRRLNRILEAADAYVEHEKAQFFSEGTTKCTTSDLISRTETVEHLRRMLEATVQNTDYDEGFIDGVEFGVSTVSTMPTIQPEPAIPLSWIENEIKWLKSLDSTFSEITAIQISAMVLKWKDEKK